MRNLDYPFKICDIDSVIDEFYNFIKEKDINTKVVLIIGGSITDSNVLVRATEHYANISNNELLVSGIDTTVAFLRPNEDGKLKRLIEEEEEEFIKAGKEIDIKFFLFNISYVIDNKSTFIQIFEDRLENCNFYYNVVPDPLY